MENKLITKATDWLGKGVIIVAVIVGGYSLAAQAFSATSALTPQAERTYQYAKLAYCNAEQSLIEAKLADYGNGLLQLSPDKVSDLALRKSKAACDFK